MLVLGIDPGIERTGFAVLASECGKIRVLDFGCIMTDKKHPFSNRLAQLATDLRSVLRQWKPSACAVEQLFFSKNVKTAMTVSHARGVILEVLEEHGIPVQELNPGHIKLAVCGDARADKLQIRKMLHFTLGIDVRQDDTADAIAAALCMITTHTY